MSLREHVTDDDVDAAIATLVASFINAQKFSVRASLERGFRKFLTRTSDYFDLLFYELRSLIRDAQTYVTLRSNQHNACTRGKCELKVLIEDFESRVRGIEYGGGDLEEHKPAPYSANVEAQPHSLGSTHQQPSVNRALDWILRGYSSSGSRHDGVDLLGWEAKKRGDPTPMQDKYEIGEVETLETPCQFRPKSAFLTSVIKCAARAPGPRVLL